MGERKPIIMLSFETGGENGGPYISHSRILNSALGYDFTIIPLWVDRSLGYRARLLNLRDQIQESKPDAVHAHGLQITGFLLALAARICKKPCVMAVRGSSLEAIDFPWHKRAVLYVLEAFALLLSTRVYCVSRYVCSWPRLRFFAGKRNAGIIYNVPHVRRGELNPKALDGIIRVISVGRINTEKGYDTLCDVILSLSDVSKVEYIIVGDGTYLEEFEHRVSQAGLADRVRFLGYLADPIPHLQESDIFITCSKHETLCNALLEAATEGLPLIGSRVGGIPEIIEDGVNGFLAEVGAADQFAQQVRLLVEDASLRKRLGEAAFAKVSDQFSEPVIMTKIAGLYRDVVSQT